MKRLTSLAGTVFMLGCLTVSIAQQPYRVITQDQQGRLVTIENNRIGWHSPTYLGTPYLDDQVWHQGYLVYKNYRQVPAAIAYNLVFDQIYCAFTDSTEVIQALPDEFIFEGRRFISNPYKVLGVARVSYYEVLYDGKTKLFCRWSKQFQPIDPRQYPRKTLAEDRFDGKYKLSRDYYIQKPGDRPRFIIPTEYSLSRVLPNMGADLADFIAANSKYLVGLTLVEVLQRYDERNTLNQAQ
jgi:hypothetical protein